MRRIKNDANELAKASENSKEERSEKSKLTVICYYVRRKKNKNFLFDAYRINYLLCVSPRSPRLSHFNSNIFFSSRPRPNRPSRGDVVVQFGNNLKNFSLLAAKHDREIKKKNRAHNVHERGTSLKECRARVGNNEAKK